MKYRAGVIFYTNYTVTADSEDDAHDKIRDLTHYEPFQKIEHSEGEFMLTEIEIIDVEEVA